MINDEIIRSFANLHPDTPIDGKLFAVPLRVIKRMLETAAAAEREACAMVAESYEPECDTCPCGVSNAIRARGQK